MKILITSLVFAGATMCAYAQSFKYEDINYNILSEVDKTCEVARSTVSGDITIPETVQYNNDQYTVTSIGDMAFSYCKSLTSITLPENVTSIGNDAFCSCENLTSITLPENVTSIGNDAFYWCESLTSITLPESLTSIGYGAFYYCKNLTSITLPESLSSIGDGAFDGCNSLTSITIPDGVISIGELAFNYCISLTEIKVGAENKSYASIDGVLFSKDLKNLIQYPMGKTGDYISPEGVTSIGKCAFMNNCLLTSITLPESLTSIGSGAFNYCESLSTLNSYATAPPVCDGVVAFSDLPSYSVLHVPFGCKDTYATAMGWSKFKKIIDDLNSQDSLEEIEKGTIDTDDSIVVYNLQGRRLNVSRRSELRSLPKCIYIVNSKKVLVK